jgi:hypothetical protein
MGVRTFMAYALTGTFIELCDCDTICPCWVGLAPNEDRCTGVFAWAIGEGKIEDVDVGGLNVVSLSFHSGHRNTGGQTVRIFVGEEASDEQLDLLGRLFSGGLGGPLAELSTLLGLLEAVERAPIAVETVGRSISVTVGRQIAGDGEVLVGADGQITELEHARLSTVLGTPAEVGRTSSFRVDMPGQGFDIQVRGRAAMRGRFDYRHEID